jgi:hypothetical protein
MAVTLALAVCGVNYGIANKFLHRGGMAAKIRFYVAGD